MENPDNLSPSVLAFVGDGVYGLCVRTYLAKENRPSGKLHSLSVNLVCAPSQAKAYSLIEGHLTENEISVFKRGRNFHTGNCPKSATRAEYHTATGLETLFGYLYLCGENSRIEELFTIITDSFDFA